MVVYTCKKCGELNYHTPHAFWNIIDFGAKCEKCETINTITLMMEELKTRISFFQGFGMGAAGDDDIRGEMFNLNGLGLGKPPAASVCLCDLNLITYLVKLGQILPLPGTICAFFNKHNLF
jgi:hypothetical protein